MSGKPNKSARFRPVRGGYRGRYTDLNGNKWRIDVAGTPEQVEWFAKHRPCHCHARPQSPAMQLTEAALKGISAATTDSVQASQPSPNNASLAVTIILEQLVDQSPYTVSFEIDPDLGADNNEHSHTFQLIGDDVSANIKCICDNGTIRMRLEGGNLQKSSGPGDDLEISIDNVALNSAWQILVMRETGDPVYTLSGDFNIAQQTF